MGLDILEKLIKGYETSADEGGIIGIGLDADIVGPSIIVAIADFHSSGTLMVEGSVKLIAVFTVATLYLDFAFILNGIFDCALSEEHGLTGLDSLLAYDLFNNLLSDVFLIDTGVAIDLHLQLKHSTKIGRHHKVRSVLLGKLGSFDGIDTGMSNLDQIGNSFAEVGLEHVVCFVQAVQCHAVQHAEINGHGCHDVLDEHVRLIAACKLLMGEDIVLAIVFAATDSLTVVDGVLRLRIAHFLKGITSEDV